MKDGNAVVFSFMLFKYFLTIYFVFLSYRLFCFAEVCDVLVFNIFFCFSSGSGDFMFQSFEFQFGGGELFIIPTTFMFTDFYLWL